MGELSKNRVPVTEMDDIYRLDDGEIIEGYFDGRDNEPCGDNRSRAYWHGWRNGMVDGGHAKSDAAQSLMAHNFVEHQRSQPTKLFAPIPAELEP